MNCKVCKKPIEDHSLDDMLACVNDESAGPMYMDAVRWAEFKGFLKSRGSDGGNISLLFKSAKEPVLTKDGAKAIYGHYLTNVKRAKSLKKGSIFTSKEPVEKEETIETEEIEETTETEVSDVSPEEVTGGPDGTE